MKKLLALLIALTMLIGLTGCSGSNEVEETEETSIDIEDTIIDTWVCEYQISRAEADYLDNAGDNMTNTIELYRGGTGRIEWHNVTQHEDRSSVSLTWEIVDENVINIDYSIAGSSIHVGLEYNADDDTISRVDGSRTFSRTIYR